MPTLDSFNPTTMPLVSSTSINVYPDATTIDEVSANALASQRMQNADETPPMFIFDAGDVLEKLDRWRRLLPSVEPFYAVKCNGEPALLRLLADFGVHFDCASRAEIESVLQVIDDEHGGDRIVFANPCKVASHVRYAAGAGVRLVTFDSVGELVKMKKLHPDARLLLRIHVDDRGAQCPLGMKFGAELASVPGLLQAARQMHLDVVGVSFHVGSGCRAASAYADAIADARHVFQQARQLGFDLDVLDIGGGFPGHRHRLDGDSVTFEEIAAVVNDAIDTHFDDSIKSSSLRVIAEPGRYFAASAFTLNTEVIGKSCARSTQHTMYYINDGVYGSFNCLLYDHAQVRARLSSLDARSLSTPRRIIADGNVPAAVEDHCGRSNGVVDMCLSSVWGPTCDGLDKVLDGVLLPDLKVGDPLVFDDMGAYTLAAASSFNGFPCARVHCVASVSVWERIARARASNTLGTPSRQEIKCDGILTRSSSVSSAELSSLTDSSANDLGARYRV